jgi:hypothetical protein
MPRAATQAKTCSSDGCDAPDEGRGYGVCFRHRLLSAGLTGMVAFKAQREFGKTGREIGKETYDRFVKAKGYPPVRADGQGEAW